MKKSFVLIARSYKYGGYCVAGLDVETKQWIRLVSSADLRKNEIPKGVFEPYDDLDVLEVEVLKAIPCGCQTENFLLDCTVPPVRKGKFSFYELLNSACVNPTPAIFGNFLSHLSAGEMARQRTSLGLYTVQSLTFDYYVGDDGKPHYRSEFLYRGNPYTGISVTDPVYRKDEFAGGTVAHALLAVSLPAEPYPNGKYYKFIAKVFPLSADEAARFEAVPSPVFAPHSHNFAYDRDAAGKNVSSAVNFLRAIADGRDPDTDAALDPARVLSSSFAARFLSCAAMLERLPEGQGWRTFKQKRTYLLRENIEKIELSDDPVTVSKLSERVNAVREPYGKKMTAVDVSSFFLGAGLIEEEGTEHKHKVPTERGREYGISAEMRLSQKGIRYVAVLYGRAAQQFFLDNLEHCAEIIDAPLSVLPAEAALRDPSRTGEDEKTPKKGLGENEEAGDPARGLGQAPAFIRKPLNAIGLNEGEEERDRSLDAWDVEEQEALVREHSAGFPLEEIAKSHRRSVATIAERLRLLNFKV